MKKPAAFLILLTTIFTLTTHAQSEKENHPLATDSSGYSFSRVWYAKAGADGNGSSEASPFGRTTEIEKNTAAGDVIILLSGDKPFEGGLALKDGQSLIGLSENGRKPIITNNDKIRNGGNGIVLADSSTIRNVQIRNTFASGIMGTEVFGSYLFEITVDSANQSGSFTNAGIRALGSFLPHGGIVFINSSPNSQAVNYISQSEVRNAAGIGIASVMLNAANGRLVVQDTRVMNGSRVGISDVGIGAFAEGPGSAVYLDLTDSAIRGRMSLAGRNVIVFASAGAAATARINRARIGISGQDGIIGATALLPATVDLEISNSVIDSAAQINVEGTMLNISAFDSTRIHETHVSINIAGSTIRNAGLGTTFDDEARNVWLGSSSSAQQANPKATNLFPAGMYKLSIRNSTIRGAADYGIGIGNSGAWFGLDPEKSTFEVLLRNNTIINNGSAALVISAPNVKVDARQNCWGTSDGFPENRLRLEATAKRSSLDATEPLPCRPEESN